MAIGVTFCLITGGVDLSIGTGMICYALFGGYLITRQGMPVIVGILGTLLLGLLMGCINGVLVAVLELPPFIATLGNDGGGQKVWFLITGGMSGLTGSFQ